MKDQLEIAFSAMLDKLEGWLRALITNIPNIVVALVVFILSLIIARIVRNIVRRSVQRTQAAASIGSLIASVTAFLVIVGGVLLVLSVLGLDGAFNGVLAGASVTGLVIGLALQNTFANTYAGIVLSLRNDIRIGDWVESKGYAGEVQRINLRNTTIKTSDNNLVYLPNRDVIESPLKTHSRTPVSRVSLTCGVAYDADLSHVREVAVKALVTEFENIPEKEIDFSYTDFGTHAIHFTISFRIDAIAEGAVTNARSRAIMSLKTAFDKEGIAIPLPITNVQLPPK